MLVLELFCQVLLLSAILSGSISVMPNGPISAATCNRCKLIKKVHLRSEGHYAYWTGWYCDDCLDWIEIDDAHRRQSSMLKMADSTMAHPLSLIIADPIGRIIASFRF